MTPTPACFCGLTDDYTAFGQPYPADIGTLGVALEPGHSLTSRREALDAAIDLLDPQLPFTLKQVDALVALAPRPNMIRVKFAEGEHGDGQPFDGPAGILAHATGPPAPGWLHMDESETWLAEPMPLSPDVAGFRMAKVFAHELGHNVGLGHSGVPGSLMFPRYTDHALALSNDDLAGLAALYETTGTNRPPAMFWGERPKLDGAPYRDGFAIEAATQRGVSAGAPFPADVEGELWFVRIPSDAGGVQFRFVQPVRSVWSETIPVVSGALKNVDLSLATLGPDVPEMPQPEPVPELPDPDGVEFVLEVPAFTIRGRML